MIPSTTRRAGIGLFLTVACAGHADAQVPFAVQSGLFNQSNTTTLGLSAAPGTETFNVFKPSASTDHFSNGVAMIGFKGQLYCQWQSSPTNEDSADTWVAYSRSSDGANWSAPMVLAANPGDGARTSGGWWVYGDTLVAYINRYPTGLTPRGGYTEYTTSTDGLSWTPVQRVKMADGSDLNGIFEQDPHALPGGRIINAAHFQPGLICSPIYTDDPLGVSGWVRPSFTNLSYTGSVTRELEPSWFRRSDGAVVMIFRDQTSTYLKLASVSTSSGQSWTTPVLTSMPDSRAKQSAGNLPDGTAYMVNNPVTNKTRIPLALTLGATGSLFDRSYLLRSGGTGLQPLVYPGTAKTLGYSYPKTTIWNGYLYAGYSVNKEDVECTRVPLASLQAPGLPSPWQSTDVGNVAAAGSASYNTGVFTVAGSGAGISGNRDEFRYVDQPASGDCTIVARVGAVQNAGTNSRTGVMIRETMNDNSAHASCSLSNGKLTFTRRSSTGGSTSTTTVNGINPPCWVRMKRVGNGFTAARSADGLNWTSVGSATIPMGTNVVIGTVVTSGADGTLTTGTLDNVMATP